MMRRMIAPLVFGLVGTAILLSLGVWQLQRMAWKDGVLAEIDARIALPPVALPEAPSEAGDEYLAVRVVGQFLPGEIHVFTSSMDRGAGYRVISPFQTENRVILVDRGFVRQTRKDEARGAPGDVIVGNLLWPNEVDPSFTPDPNLETNTWFARDLPVMAKYFNSAPILVVLRRLPKGETAISPWPVNSADISNTHLQYAITWLLMALGWFGMTGYWLWRIRRGKDY
ncbi:MAG: SURF1 family protein [Alphaproteobacteria bacterium]|nr:SURF1 family protein [Alphaproteobacteria bacterium]